MRRQYGGWVAQKVAVVLEETAFIGQFFNLKRKESQQNLIFLDFVGIFYFMVI